MVTGIPSFAAIRRMRFFIVVEPVPSGIGMRVAVFSSDWSFRLWDS
jgi:hypothetical protein